MALIDVKNYYLKLYAQHNETAQNIKELEDACKAGYITQDRLKDTMAEIEKEEANYERISYIMYLLDLPKSKKSKEKFKKTYQSLPNYFKNKKADLDSIVNENLSVITHIKNTVKKIQDENNKEVH